MADVDTGLMERALQALDAPAPVEASAAPPELMQRALQALDGPEEQISPESGMETGIGLESTGEFGVETAPLEPPREPPPAIPMGIAGSVEMMRTGEIGPFEAQKLEIPEGLKKAAAAGVVFDKPAPGGHFLSSLALNDKNKIAAYKTALRESLGSDVEVRVGPETGLIEYLDPETNRFALADPPGSLEAGSLGGPALVFGPELAAGLSSALVTKSPALVNIASSAGAGLGEIGRLTLGREMGINKDVTDAQIIKEAAKTVGITAASGEAFRVFAKASKFIIDTIQGKTFQKALLKDLDLTANEAQDIADKINKKVDGEKLKFDLAQSSGDDDLLNQRDALRKSQKFSKEFGAFEDDQFKALEEFNSVINRPFRSRLETPAQVGGAVQDVARSNVQTETARANIPAQLKNAELAAAESNIKARPLESVGADIRGAGAEEQKAFREWANEAATALNDVAGNKAFIPNKSTIEAVKSIDSTVQDALFPSLQKSQRTLIGEATSDEEQKVLRKVFDPDAKFTFKESWEAISALKRLERVASKGLSTDAPAVGAIKRLYQGLEKDLKTAAQSSPLREQYDQFIKQFAQGKALLDEGTVGKIMARSGGKNGRFEVADDKVFNEVFTPGSDRGAEEVLDLIKNRPEQMQGMREAIGDFYKRNVMPDGRVDLRKHRKFMEDHGRSLQKFFNKGEMQIFAKPGQVEKALQARETARDEAVDKINKTFDADIANLNNPGRVVKLIMDNTNPDKARALMNTLERTPDVKRAVQAQFTRDMAERVKTVNRRGSRTFSPDKLDKFLNGSGGEGGFKGVAKEVMGPEYVDNLNTLNQAMKIVSREPRFPNRSNTAFWNDTVKGLARAYVGLFTRPGRVITALDRIRGRAADRVISKAFLNPGDMRDLMSLKNVDMRTGKAAAILGNLGGSALLQDFGDEPRPTGRLK